MNPIEKLLILSGSVLVLAVVPTGCKAPPAPPAGFADPDGMRSNPKLPFHRVWRDRSFDFESRRHMLVAAVDTEYLMGHTWWQGFGRGSKAHADVIELAIEFRRIVAEAFGADSARRFEVIDEEELSDHRDSALILELAIVELVPQKALIQTLTYPVGPFGLLARKGMNSLGSTMIAMEGRVRDAATGNVVARFADREKKKAGLLNAKNFTWYGHVRGILEEWSQQFVEVANKSPDDTVPDSPAWRLLPW